MFKIAPQLNGLSSLADIRFYLINTLTLLALGCLIVLIIALYATNNNLYILDLFALPLIVWITIPKLLSIRTRSILFIAILIVMAVVVAYSRTAPMGGRVWIVLAAALGTILISSRVGYLVLAIGLVSLCIPTLLCVYGFIQPMGNQPIPTFLDIAIQILSGLPTGLLIVFTVSFTFSRLVKSDQQRRAVTDQVADIIWSTDPDLNFTFVTPSVEKTLGFTQSQVIGRNLKEYVGEKFVQNFEQTFVPNLRTSGETVFSDPIVKQLRHIDSTKVWTETTLHFVRDSNLEFTAVTGVTRDISHKKQLEERQQQLEAQLRQSQKMESVGQLAGGIAHDFNNLLSIILGYADLIQNTELNEVEIQECVAAISKAGDRAAALTEQLLLFSRNEPIDMKALNVNSLIRDIESMLVRLVPENITLDCLIDDGSSDLVQVMADQGQLEQVLVNLIVNARDSIQGDGKIQVKTTVLNLDANYTDLKPWSKPGWYSCITVADTGIGITREIQTRIFEPFFTTKEQGKGTGLGLAVVFGIVKQHGGFVNVYSEVDKGSEFKVFLPIDGQSEVTTTTDYSEAEVAGGDECILVIEDNEALCELAVRILSKAGYKVIAEPDGEAGLAQFLANSETISLVFTDVVMPKLGGRALAEKIRVIKPGLPILFASGYTGEELHLSDFTNNGLNIMTKPYSPNALLRRIRILLD